MSDSAKTQPMSAEQYLEWERLQTSKHEYHSGTVFAMAGGSPRHNFLAAAITGELRSALSSSDCRVLSSDQRISARRGERYVYPDAVVVCGRIELEASDVLSNPTVVVEVHSSSTEGYDRGGKWALYQALSSLTDYVLMSQDALRIEHFRRKEDGGWHYEVVGAAQDLVLANGARLSVDAIYRGAFELSAE